MTEPQRIPDEVLQATGKTEAQLQAELAAKSAEIDAKLAKSEVEIVNEKGITTGEDLEFDLDKFIMEGVITKKNVALTSDLFVDIQSLTHRQRILAEAFVEELLGKNAAQDSRYFSVLEAAILAMAITRMNNLKFPMPTAEGPLVSKDEKAIEVLSTKKKLFYKLVDSPEEFVRALSLLYGNLGLAEVLSEINLKK